MLEAGKTKEISGFLKKNNISSDYYHAGIDTSERDKKQAQWMKNRIRVMVATNAFGMGIDKPDVRFVIHFDIPDSLEAYFQEAGRAGRDEKLSFAVLLFDDADISNAKRKFSLSFPDPDKIRVVYRSLGNFLQLPVGGGKELAFDFDMQEFCENYKLPPILVHNSLQFLEREGYLLMNQALSSPSRLHFILSKEDLYRFQVENPLYDNFTKILLRSYSGIFTDFVKINESILAKRIAKTREFVVTKLLKLNKLGVITYIPQNTLPQIVYCRERVDIKDIYLSKENYRDRKSAARTRLESVIEYAQSNNKCRSQLLLLYFGDSKAKRCGKCDVCLKRNKLELSELEFDIVLNQIKPLLKVKSFTPEELSEQIRGVNDDSLINVITWLLDNDKIFYDKERRLRWRN
jgi:ATP-dependent DNA helicase RecQ